MTSSSEAVLRLAAGSPDELLELLDQPITELLAGPVGSGPARLALVDPSPRRLAVAAKVLAGRRAWSGRNDIWFTSRPFTGGTTFVFPGLEAEFAPRCADVAEHFGLTAPAPIPPDADLLTHSHAVMDVGLLLAAALRRIGIVPDALCGHSVGEWTAMADGGMYGDLHGDVDLHALRRRFWPDAFPVPDVVFAALGCSADRARRHLGRDVVVSHDNAPRQSVVCGPAGAVEAVLPRLRAEGVVARVLPFRSGFHTPMFAPQLDPFRALTEALPMRRPSVPVWSATTAAPFPAEPARVRALYLRHLVDAVRFRELVSALHDDGQRIFVVVGPGQVGTFVADTLADRPHVVVNANSDRRDGLAQLRRAALAYWVHGGSPDLAALDGATAGGAPDQPPVRRRRPVAAPHPAPAAAAPGPRPRVQEGHLPALPVHEGHLPARQVQEGHLAEPGVGGAGTRPASSDAVRGASALLGPAGLPPLVAAEFAALLAETERAAHAVLTAGLSAVAGPARPVRTPRPAAPARPTAVRTSTVPSDRTTSATAVTSIPEHRVVLDVSMAAMPYLTGHRFHLQRADWPDESDRRPVVAATTILTLVMDEVRRAWPGVEVAGVADARFDRWLLAAPAQRVELVLRRESPDEVRVTVGGFAGLTVRLGRPAPPGTPWAPPADDGPSPITADGAYADRLLFHGAGYRGLTTVTGLGRAHARATITAPEAPGGLLDNVGQLMGIWLHAHHHQGLLAFPRRIASLQLFAPLPPPGTTLECLALVHVPTDDTLTMDAQLVRDGTVIAEVRGWQDIRLDCDRQSHRAWARPDVGHLSRAHPDGWVLVEDRWRMAAARDMFAGAYLAADERDRYRELPPKRARQWLLGRIAAKDAVRRHVDADEDGDGPRFPAEIAVTNGEHGRPQVHGHHRPLPPTAVSLAHSGTVGVALAGPPGSAPGIDVEQVVEPAPATVAAALHESEQHMLGASGSSGLWFTRFWAAKEAVGKARGTGLAGAPLQFRVEEADEHVMLVRDPDGATHRVRHSTIVSSGQTYVVAHTGGAHVKEER